MLGNWKACLALILALFAAVIAGCGSLSLNSQQVVFGRGTDDAPSFGLGRGITHLASVAGDFVSPQDGADYAADLSHAHVTPSGTSVVFHSQWPMSGGSIGDSAYCLYRLELAEQSDAELELNWAGSQPAGYWIALANWDTQAWDWLDAGSLSNLLIHDAQPYSDASNRCYLAIVVLSIAPVELASVGFASSASDGYTLFGPLGSTTTYLIEMDGTVVHTWDSDWTPGNSVELDADGYLWHTCMLNNPNFNAGGSGGRIEKLDWDGNVVWSYELSSTTACQHHDFELLTSGNVLLVVWQEYSIAESVQAGRDPSRIPDGEVWADSIIEIEPVGMSGGNIVWEWRLWDHLIQDFDSTKDNFGVVGDHPELVDINFGVPGKDWTHVNSVDYNAELDQIAISSHNFSELWIIDHSTTTVEAASHSGGNSGMGGDIMYRWGNPRTYDAGTIGDQVLFGQHDVQWITDGLEGAGNLIIYNNGMNRPGDDYSSIVEISTPVDLDGNYLLAGSTYGPETPAWEYIADPPNSFFSGAISGVQRLPSGNTLVCCGNPGWFFEVDAAGNILWEYQNTYGTGTSVFRCTRYAGDYPGLAAL